MTPGTGPAFEQAMSDLLLQVNRDNILAAQAVFKRHADDLFTALSDMERLGGFSRCGDDPVSHDTLGPASFFGKIEQLKRVHWDHEAELRAVVDRLGDTAKSYGYTEAEIKKNLEKT